MKKKFKILKNEISKLKEIIYKNKENKENKKINRKNKNEKKNNNTN